MISVKAERMESAQGDQTKLYWLWGGADDIGGRKEQQDRWGVFITPDGRGLLAVVADGMGGHLDGALAAETVLEESRRYAHTELALLAADPRNALEHMCRDIHAAIYQRSQVGHSTAVILWLYGKQAHWAHVGDSRCYHFRNGNRLMRTRDHSAVQLLVDLGEVKEEEMGRHPAQNRLYRSLGGADAPKPDFGRDGFESGDVFVLCSDGLWEYVNEAELWTCGRAGRLSRGVARLVKQAVQRGGPRTDNATLVMIRPVAKLTWLERIFGR